VLSNNTRIKTFAARLIKAVCEKTAASHVALRGNFSSLVCSTNPVKVSKDTASHLVCTRKKFLLGEWVFFVSDVISGGLLGHLGPLYLALGTNR